MIPYILPLIVITFLPGNLIDKLQIKKADLFFYPLSFFKIKNMAFRKLPCFFAKRAEYIPGLLFNDLIHKPESSDITGYLTNLRKK